MKVIILFFSDWDEGDVISVFQSPGRASAMASIGNSIHRAKMTKMFKDAEWEEDEWSFHGAYCAFPQDVIE